MASSWKHLDKLSINYPNLSESDVHPTCLALGTLARCCPCLGALALPFNPIPVQTTYEIPVPGHDLSRLEIRPRGSPGSPSEMAYFLKRLFPRLEKIFLHDDTCEDYLNSWEVVNECLNVLTLAKANP
ncbi:hypothetical protein JAAARDRAFT_588705 [Jaapia argillacea MUCL 33604]|uniref:Uncharacterized protein n=1 Tax=Jaapia argillacea MUCL 33604 TaxID=933084 RepID=A0A067P610_9AGAM|nr:hypothetical protein JAAARDRAFT_588705 [Jaapia argillacea MUCL 33604]